MGASFLLVAAIMNCALPITAIAESPIKRAQVTICSNGLAGYPGTPRRPVRADQVSIAVEFLRRCRSTRWARPVISPAASQLKHDIERWAGTYISTGAAITACTELGIVIVPYGGLSRDALIGVRLDDVTELASERRSA
jgi:hypothetical protein